VKTGDIRRIWVDSASSLNSLKGARSAVEHVAKWARRAGYAGQGNGFRRRVNGLILLYEELSFCVLKSFFHAELLNRKSRNIVKF